MSDPETEPLRQRLRAVERAVTDDDRSPAELADAAEATGRIESLEDRMDEIEERVAELEAATQALRGYVGNVRSVNEEIRNRAESALSIARDLQSGRPTSEGDLAEHHELSPEDGPVTAETSAAPPTTPDPPDGEKAATTDRWDGAAGPWEPAGEDRSASRDTSPPEEERPPEEPDRRPSGGRVDQSETDGNNDAESKWRKTDWPADRDGETSAPDGVERDPEGTGGTTARSDRQWPPEGTAGPSTGNSDEWPPEGMDVERAQPWAVPDPGDEEWNHEDDRTLLDRVREAL